MSWLAALLYDWCLYVPLGPVGDWLWGTGDWYFRLPADHLILGGLALGWYIWMLWQGQSAVVKMHHTMDEIIDA